MSQLLNPVTKAIMPTAQARGGVTTRAPLGTLMACGTNVGAVTVYRPSPRVSGSVFAVIDSDGNAGANNVIVDGDGDLIDGSSTCVLTVDGENAFFLYNDGEWRRLLAVRVVDGGAEVEYAADLPPDTATLVAAEAYADALVHPFARIGPTTPTDYYPTVGTVRLPPGSSAWVRDSVDSRNICVFDTGLGDDLYLGCDRNIAAGATFNVVNMYAVTAVALGVGGATFLYCISGNVEHWRPSIGSSSGSSPWGAVDGMTLVTVAGSNIVLTAAQYCTKIIRFTGAPAGTRTITFPHPANAGESYTRWIWPAQTVSGLIISTGTGTTVSLTTVNNLPIELLFTNLGVTRPTVTP